MSTVANAITWQVSEQVKRAMEAAGSAKPPPPLEYPLAHEGEPSHRPEGIPSLRLRERGRETSRSDRRGRVPTRRQGGRAAMAPIGRSAQWTTTRSATASTPYATHSRRTKALHKLADRGQIDRFLKRGPRFLRQEQEPASPPPRDEECSMKIVATIAGLIVEGMNRSAWKAQLRSAQQVLTVEQGSYLTAPTIVFRGKDAP
ncbi:hypothetical protein Cgig2_005126 [Carnegiea gigantea]|uniref:Uncharacterized protein n=1 Tax=Carnegiea gigantea TaxID=171969 RepID=A0A9Q1QHZ8_9CARY|nr:hypothetical protein Cgig2_005126 [Carnegiea gigantea]